MELHYSKMTSELEAILDRIHELTLAIQLVELSDEGDPALVDGSKKYLGLDKMNNYLNQLDNEKEQWYYCNC